MQPTMYRQCKAIDRWILEQIIIVIFLTISYCRAIFFISGISMDRPLRLAKWYADNQTSRPERRGGSRNDDKWKERKLLISEHIQSFTCRAGHFARVWPSNKRCVCNLCSASAKNE